MSRLILLVWSLGIILIDWKLSPVPSACLGPAYFVLWYVTAVTFSSGALSITNRVSYTREFVGRSVATGVVVLSILMYNHTDHHNIVSQGLMYGMSIVAILYLYRANTITNSAWTKILYVIFNVLVLLVSAWSASSLIDLVVQG